MALRTILPQDFYVEMTGGSDDVQIIAEGEEVFGFIIWHDCDGMGTSAIAEPCNHGLRCPKCKEVGVIQQ